jgi:hypothetical protein
MQEPGIAAAAATFYQFLTAASSTFDNRRLQYPRPYITTIEEDL